MSSTEVLLYQELDGTIPVLDRLKSLQRTNRRAFENVCSCSICWKNLGTNYGVRGLTETSTWRRVAFNWFVNHRKNTRLRGRSLMAKKTTDALDIIRGETGVDPRTDPSVHAYRRPFEIAQMIYDARTAAGLTQQQLADLIGTKQPVISQLESADYEGQSLAMLERIAEALHLEVQLRLVQMTVR
jgi:DNA-binding XRE family transcriptional regulator